MYVVYFHKTKLSVVIYTVSPSYHILIHKINTSFCRDDLIVGVVCLVNIIPRYLGIDPLLTKQQQWQSLYDGAGGHEERHQVCVLSPRESISSQLSFPVRSGEGWTKCRRNSRRVTPECWRSQSSGRIRQTPCLNLARWILIIIWYL